MLHWEDIGLSNARRLLDHYRDNLLTFNDDIQGTGAVNLAAVLAAVRGTGTSLRDHRIGSYGAGTAGKGTAEPPPAASPGRGRTEEEHRERRLGLDQESIGPPDLDGISG